MTTVVNNPPTASTSTGNSGWSVGMIVGIVVAIGVIVLLFAFFGLIREGSQPANETSGDAPTVDVPDKIDINVDGNLPSVIDNNGQ